MKWLRACSEELQAAVQRRAECCCGDCLDEIARDELDERHKGGANADGPARGGRGPGRGAGGGCALLPSKPIG